MVMGSGASSDVAAAAADVIAADRAFWSKTMDVPVAHGDTATSAKVYVSGGGAVSRVSSFLALIIHQIDSLL